MLISRHMLLRDWGNFEQGWLPLSERLFHASAKQYRALHHNAGIASSYAGLAVLRRRRNLWRQSLTYSYRALRLLRPSTPLEAHLKGGFCWEWGSCIAH